MTDYLLLASMTDMDILTDLIVTAGSTLVGFFLTSYAGLLLSRQRTRARLQQLVLIEKVRR